MSAAGLIERHLEQISSCAQTITELEFQKPKIFANALLKPHDITTLIRDTEAHERALFTVPKPETNRRRTVFPDQSAFPGGPPQNAVRGPRRNTAVAAALGGDLVERIKRGGGGGAGSALGYREGGGRDKGEVDVDVLLEGVEKLCHVYPIAGALDRVATLRQRHHNLKSSIAFYENRIAENAEELSKLQPKEFNDFGDDDVDLGFADDSAAVFTEQDVKQEEKEIRELEHKKILLEARVNSMEQDIKAI